MMKLMAENEHVMDKVRKEVLAIAPPGEELTYDKVSGTRQRPFYLAF